MTKPKSEFGNYKKTPDGLRHYCRNCNNEKARLWSANNKDKKKANSDKWYKENKEYAIELAKQWARNNRKKASKSVSNWTKNKRETDPIYKLQSNISCLIRNGAMLYGFKKTSRTAKILGCSIEEFKTYIEKQFKKGMFWENYGEWEFDHKTPISWAKTEEEVFKLNHYTNFQPLWKIENIKKGNRFAS